jgi:drug/metabolite transporter (DMT)-like permease
MSDPIPASTPRSLAQKNLRGIIAMMLAMMFFVVNDTLVKLARVQWDTGQILAFRGFFSLAAMLVWVWVSGAGSRIGMLLRRDLVARALLEAFVASTFITALGMMALADITALLLVAPLVITALSMVIFKEKIGWRRWSAVIVGFCGMLLVVQPGGAAVPPLALALTLTSVLGVALRDLTTRRFPADVPSVIIALASIIGTMVIGIVLSFTGAGWKPLEPFQLAIIGSAGLFVIAGNYAIIEAFRDVELSVVSPFRYSVILWAVLLGILVFGDWPTPLALAGIALIGASGLYTLHRERVRSQEARRDTPTGPVAGSD